MMLHKLLVAGGVVLSVMVAGCGGDDAPAKSTSAGGSGGSSTGGSSSGGSSSGGSGGSSTGGSGGSSTGGSGGAPAAMPRGADNPPTLGMPIDRAGRPAVSTALVGAFAADADEKGMLKDEYNAAPPDAWSDFEDEIRTSLAILDSLDENCGNQLLADASDTRYATLASILADDRLYVLSTQGECGVYLGLEGEIAGALDAGDGMCGGRMPADDIIDRSYSVLAAGVLTGVDDTITENDEEFSDEFPFLAAPH